MEYGTRGQAIALQRWRSALFVALLCGGLAGCPGCPESDLTPSTDLSVTFRVDPSATQVVTAGGSVTYRVVVDQKGILNAGVEFEARNVPAGLTVTFDSPRIAETARETQMIVRTTASMRPGDHTFEVRGRLYASGGSPEWYTPTFGPPTVRVTGGTPAFDLTCDDATLDVRGGAERATTCRVRRDTGFTSNIDFAFGSRPSYLTVTPDPTVLTASADSITFRIQRAPLVPAPASVELVLNATGAGTTRQHTYRVELPSDAPIVAFEMVCPGEVAIVAGGSRTLACQILRSEGFTTPISLSFGSPPSFLTINSPATPVGPGQSTVEFSIVRAPGVQPSAFVDIEVIARAFPFEKRVTVRVHLPNA